MIGWFHRNKQKIKKKKNNTIFVVESIELSEKCRF